MEVPMEEHSELSMEPLSAARMATNPISEASKAALRKSLAESGKVADYPPEELWKVAGVGEDGLMNREEFESMLVVLKEHVLKRCVSPPSPPSKHTAASTEPAHAHVPTLSRAGVGKASRYERRHLVFKRASVIGGHRGVCIL